jgi:hypothetical protein
MNVNSRLGLAVFGPPAVVTVTGNVPAGEVGVVVVISVSLTTVKVAITLPNFTDVAPVNPVPSIVTAVPPAAGPIVAEMLVTLGAGT